MKAKQIFKIILFVVLFLGVVAYITYAMLDLSGGDPKELCTELSLVVEENPHADFIDAKQVEKMLQDANVYPKGKLMKDIDTRQIEQMLKADNFIESVECFKTNNGMEVGKGKVCVRVKQRTPVVYVLPDNAAGYYVDAEGTVIPNTVYAKNIVTATGIIAQEFAREQLAPFGAFIQSDSFWDNQIEQIYVSLNSKREPVVTLVPRVGDQTIYMGSLEKYEKKLRRMRIFYEKALVKVGWNKYSRFNLEYDNQVVCTKREKRQ